MTPQNTSDTGERVSTFVSTLANFEGLKFIIRLYYWAEMKKERVIGIEPNEHQIPRFQGKYSSSHSSARKPYRDPILPIFSLCLSAVGVWDSSVL